jgi:hypothetical protein
MGPQQIPQPAPIKKVSSKQIRFTRFYKKGQGVTRMAYSPSLWLMAIGW